MTRAKVKLRVFTHSERQTWRACPARHGYAYLERLRPDRATAWQRDGTLYHRCTALTIDDVVDHMGARVFAEPEFAADVAESIGRGHVIREIGEAVGNAELLGDQDVLEELGETRRWLEYAVVNYFRSTWRDWTNYALIGVELPFRVPIRDAMGRPIAHVMHEGVIDLLMLHRATNRVAVMDHKALASFGNYDRRLQLEDQTTGYLYAARELWRANRLPYSLAASSITEDSFSLVVHNLARKAAPAEPGVNRVKKADVGLEESRYKEIKALEDADGRSRGRVSMAACDTTAEVFERALAAQENERGIPVDDEQRARVAQLRARGETFFRRVEQVRTARDLERWCAEYVVDQRRMREAELDERMRTRNPGHCTGPAAPACPYQVICEMGAPASSRQGDVFGFVRVDDPHEEVRRGEEEWKQRQQRRKQVQQEAPGGAEGGPGPDRAEGGAREPDGSPGDRAQEAQPQAAHGRAEGEGERGEPPRGRVAEADHGFF